MLHKKFTLIELLVVVAIIGILAAMILPALGSARDKAQQSNCKSSLKMIGLSVRMYFIEDPEAAMPGDNSSTTLTSNHAWVTAMEIEPDLLSCAAKHIGSGSNRGQYETITLDGTYWGDIVTDSDVILVEDLSAHESSGNVNRLHSDGHVSSGRPSN